MPARKPAPEAAPRQPDPAPTPPRKRRQGPRPLATHLTAAMAVLLNSRAGLPLLNGSSPIWRKELETRRSQLHADLAGADPEALAAAVDRETRRRLDTLLTGLERYRHNPYQRDVADPPPLWTEGGSRLLDYGLPGAKGPVLLFVPSLVNRGYVLDLSARKSLVRWLATKGFRPFLLDWGTVGPVERGYGLSEYVAGRLARAVDAVRDLSGQAPALVGYCMGGTLATAAAVLRPESLSALVLLAAPWDFHVDDPAAALRTAAALPLMEPALTWLGELPVDMIQFLFAAMDPLLALRKFSRYAGLDPESQDARDFVALEDWLNDGVPLAANVARDCLGGWYGRNDPAAGTWRVDGRVIAPAILRLPTLAIIPARDRIVPPGAARALIDAIPGGDRLEPRLGHIGMVVSAGAPQEVWAPLADWLTARLA